jgi:hypothetical protein
MRMTMVMYNKDAFNCAAHAIVFVIVLETLEACGD